MLNVKEPGWELTVVNINRINGQLNLMLKRTWNGNFFWVQRESSWHFQTINHTLQNHSQRDDFIFYFKQTENATTWINFVFDSLILILRNINNSFFFNLNSFNIITIARLPLLPSRLDFRVLFLLLIAGIITFT